MHGIGISAVLPARPRFYVVKVGLSVSPKTILQDLREGGMVVVSASSCAKMLAGTENSLGQTCPHTIVTTNANQNFSLLTGTSVVIASAAPRCWLEQKTV